LKDLFEFVDGGVLAAAVEPMKIWMFVEGRATS
jgi:hypothetical protein